MTAPNDKKLTIILWMIGIVVTILCGVAIKGAYSYGRNSRQVEENTEDILDLKRNSADVVYIDNLIQSNYLMIDVIKSNPLTSEKDDALKEWKDFQIRVMRQANPTRGLTSSGGNGTSNGK
jgi:hypothetical protein